MWIGTRKGRKKEQETGGESVFTVGDRLTAKCSEPTFVERMIPAYACIFTKNANTRLFVLKLTLNNREVFRICAVPKFIFA